MELRATSVLLLILCAIIIITTEGHIPICCLRTSQTIKRNILKYVHKYEIQSDAGPCELKALIVYKANKKFCYDIKLKKKVEKWLKKRHVIRSHVKIQEKQ